ncbi:MAG: hypothetical protein HWN69_09925 [Desulfobacterales bacterium]|nr:hypothetical protein [Desulfobacterales bacterium]
MIDEDEVSENDLEENQVSFFKCKKCGSCTLRTTNILDLIETIQQRLPCSCGEEEDAAYRTEQIRVQVEETGYLLENRHFTVEDSEREELDRDTLDEDIICEKCYRKYKDRSDLWEVTKNCSEEEESNLTIRCDGCDHEIEFGYSHLYKQGRIFLEKDDRNFKPRKTLLDPKYVEKWKKRGWLRPTK